jgi:fatty-acyl-CoA synthase
MSGAATNNDTDQISSVDLENQLMPHPAVAHAAVIAVPDDRWGKHPLAVVSLRTGAGTSLNEPREHLAQEFAKWQLPDRVEFVAAIPSTATEKVKKTQLRDQFT